jgi:erythromycin esterase
LGLSVCAALVGCLSLDTPASGPIVNLDMSDPVIAWMVRNSISLRGTNPALSGTDLGALESATGSAHIIGVGEATHGTHEFFEMKHRLLRDFVTKLGVTAFAIEATLPEAFELDTYVRTGSGDPTRALSHLYFWTWRTQEVADMIAWMREYNRTRPAEQRIGFYGVDMQYPGQAARGVLSYLSQARSALQPTVTQFYSCLDGYLNDDAGRFPADFASLPADTRAKCLASVTAAHDSMVAHAVELEAQSSAAAYQKYVRFARVVVQWVTRSDRNAIFYRDLAMAENARWVLSQQPRGGRVLLWAHNAHVMFATGSMGRALRDSLQSDYVNIGFAFDSGSFNARPSLTDEPTALRIGAAPSVTYEARFRLLNTPFYIDLRSANSYNTRLWLSGGVLRDIGAVFYEGSPNLVQRRAAPIEEYDVMIFFPRSTPSKLLPFTP